MIPQRILAALCGFAILLSGAPTLAADNEGAFSVSPMFGLYRFDSDEGVDRNGTGFGLGFGYYYTDQLMVEGFGVMSSSEFSPSGADFDTSVLGLDLTYHFTDLGWVWTPYLSAGLGYRTRDPSVLAATDNDVDGVVVVGGGVKYFFADDMAFRIDARFYRDLNSNDGEFDHASLMGGIDLLFGKALAPVPALMPAPAPMPEPAPAPVDSDGDGVFDDADRCPGTPAGVPVDGDGCPLDSDGDGVIDADDLCPGTPPGTEVDARGCAKLKAPVTMGLRVEFDFDSASLRNTEQSRLDEVVAFMKQYPNAVATIEGHTDSRGSDEYNQRLAEARAEAVRMFLIEHGGIAADRLRAVGYGEQSPVADNDNDAGRQQNRRVVAVIIEPS